MGPPLRVARKVSYDARMRIGSDDCYLRIERDDPTDWYAPLRLEARLRAPGRAQFFGWSDVASISAGAQELEAFLKFTEWRAGSVSLPLSDNGSLELKRDAHGHIDVLFTIGCLRVGPHWKVSGDVRVEGEYTQEFLRDFREIVFGPSSV